MLPSPQEREGGDSGEGGQRGRRCPWQGCRGEVAVIRQTDLQVFLCGLGVGTQTSQSRKHVNRDTESSGAIFL